MLILRGCRHLLLPLFLLSSSPWARAYELFYDARVGTAGSIAATCSVAGAQVVTGGGCQGYSGYSASLYDPSLSPLGSVPFNQALGIDSSAVVGPGAPGGGGTLNSSAISQAVVPVDGTLAGFRVTADHQTYPGSSAFQINSWGYLDLRISESISIDIPSSYDGQDVYITVNVPYDGSYSGYQGTGVREDAYTYGQLEIEVSMRGSGRLASDLLTLGYAPTTVSLDGVLTSGVILVRSASSTDRTVDLDFAMRISAGILGGAGFYDVDFLHTLYFDAVLPPGVTADLGILANRESSIVNGAPEPGTLTLLALGFAGLAMVRRKVYV